MPNKNDRQTDRQTNRYAHPSIANAFSVIIGLSSLKFVSSLRSV